MLWTFQESETVNNVFTYCDKLKYATSPRPLLMPPPPLPTSPLHLHSTSIITTCTFTSLPPSPLPPSPLTYLHSASTTITTCTFTPLQPSPLPHSLYFHHQHKMIYCHRCLLASCDSIKWLHGQISFLTTIWWEMSIFIHDMTMDSALLKYSSHLEL